MQNLLLLALLAVIASCSKLDDAAFVKKYNVQVIKKGVRKDYPQKGDWVIVHYTAFLPGGQKYDSSFDKRQPYQFDLGLGQVIECWDEVVAYMTIDDSVVVTCPAALAYGETGAGDVIPPNTDLEFQIKLIAFGKHQKVDL